MSERSTYSASTCWSYFVSSSVDRSDSPWGSTNPVLEEVGHEPAAQLLAEADDTILGARVDLEVEAFSSNNVVNEFLAVVLYIGCDLLLQDRVPDKRLDGVNVLAAYFLDDNLDFFKDLTLDGLVARGGSNGLQFFEHL